MARLFNGSTENFKLTGLDLSLLDKITVAFRAYHDTNTDDAIRCLFDFGTDSNGGIGITTTWNSATPFLVQKTQSSTNRWTGPAKASATTWHQYLITIPFATDPIFWIDGVFAALTRNDGNIAGNYGAFTACWGSRAGGDRFWGGRIADFAMWGKIPNFGPPEALALYQGLSPLRLYPRHLILYVPFFGAPPDYALASRVAPLNFPTT